ncbi:MAG: UbiA-like polyprenyltransferase [Bacteroidales bacterium]
MIKRIKNVPNYFSFIKFAHTLFALPFGLIGFVLALTISGESFSLTLLLLVLIAMVAARSAAMGFNRYKDRDIDSLNPRTKQREIPAGKISPSSALTFVIVNSFIFLTAAWFINLLCFILAFPTLLVLLGYSYFKRFSALSHYILGGALAIAPTGAYIAVTGSFHIAPVILSGLVLLWVSGFDIIYSLGDEKFDINNSLHSIPQLIGAKKALMVSSVGHILVVPMLLLFYFIVNDLGLIYIIGAIIFSGLLLWQHLIISAKDLSRIDAAFFTANGIASFIFALFTITDLLT